MGYLYASFYDYKKLNVWMSAYVFGTSARPILPAVTLTANIPKPKFEFYTLLTKDSSTGASAVHAPVTSSTSSAPSTSSQPMSLTVTPASAGTTAHAVLPVPLMAETIAHSAPVLANKETYLVQLASFRAREEAERMRAALILKGFDVNVSVAIQQNIQWYRVVMGPYVSREDAQRAQGAFARRERIMGMIRKMDT